MTEPKKLDERQKFDPISPSLTGDTVVQIDSLKPDQDIESSTKVPVKRKKFRCS